MFRKVLILSIGLGLLFLMTGCATAAEASTVRITAKEWAFQPSRSSVPAGKVTFELVNQGKITHEMVLVKTDLPAKGLAPRADDPSTMDTAAAGQVPGEIQNVAAGAAKTEALTLTPGRYLLVCNQAGHYKVGMVTEFTVTT